jgi:hypothetical protein
VTIGHNAIGVAADRNPWQIQITPQNTGADTYELIRDVIAENTVFTSHTSGTVDFQAQGQNITLRGSTKVHASEWGLGNSSYTAVYPTHNGPYFVTNAATDWAGSDETDVTIISAFADPGKPTGAA